MNDQPLVSIVVRTYNRPERLRECLQSLREQQYRPLEIVVVNDSGEDVFTIVQDELDDVMYKYISHRVNLGRTAGLNTGVEAASGEYINFVDDDDGVYPHHIQTLVNAAMPNRLPVVYSDVLNVTFQRDPNTNEWKRVQEQLVYSFDFERDNFLLANYIPVTCLLIRRDCFDTVGPFDESLLVYEDWEYLIRLSRKFEFKHTAVVTGEYRRRDDNSNLCEQDAYIANEKVVKRRYQTDRDAVFDGIFKSTFQLKREIRNRIQQLQQLMQQSNNIQAQLAQASNKIQGLEQQVQRLQTG